MKQGSGSEGGGETLGVGRYNEVDGWCLRGDGTCPLSWPSGGDDSIIMLRAHYFPFPVQ